MPELEVSHSYIKQTTISRPSKDRSAWVGALGFSGRPRAQGPTRRDLLTMSLEEAHPHSNPKRRLQTVLAACTRPSKLRWGRSAGDTLTAPGQQASQFPGWLQTAEAAPRSWAQALAAAAPPTQGRGGRHAHPEVAL